MEEEDLIGEPLEEVPKRKPDEDCNARRDDGRFLGYCNRTAGWGTDSDEGRCRTHGGNGGAPEGNQNAVTHGAYAQHAIDSLTEGEQEAFEEVATKLEDPESAQEIAFVRQDPYIFNETLWFNLTIEADDQTESEVDRVCEIARVSEFFDDMNDGYQTTLGEDGVQLSGEQCQCVALARALLKETSVLLLDEATSDLDTGIGQEVQRSMES